MEQQLDGEFRIDVLIQKELTSTIGHFAPAASTGKEGIHVPNLILGNTYFLKYAIEMWGITGALGSALLRWNLRFK